MSVVANPFADTKADWAFYVIGHDGALYAASNSYDWCEWFITCNS